LNDEKDAYLISYKATNLYNITVHLIIENFDRLQKCKISKSNIR